jgi:MFS family permease
VAVQIAAPYFNPYMLGYLKFSYWAYVVLICAANVAKIAFLPLLGRSVQRWGAYRVFWLSAVGIVVLPGMWLFSSDFRYLVAIQVFSGALWAANDLASFMLFIETIPREKRVSILTMFNLANSVATVAGSLLGGALLLFAGTGGTTYLLLFTISTIARAAALMLLVRVPAAATSRQASPLVPVASLLPRAVPAGRTRPRYLQHPRPAAQTADEVQLRC